MIVFRAGEIAVKSIVVLIILSLICYSAYLLTFAKAQPSKNNTHKPAVWTELKTERNQNTRVWEISRQIKKKDPVTNKFITEEVKSKVIEKGCGICCKDSNNQWQITDIHKQKTIDRLENQTLTENEIWYADATYYISSNIIIASGVELKIEPGTIVKFDNGTYIDARNGKLTANGKPYEYIVFTNKCDSNMGEIIDSNEPMRGCWGGLCLSEDDCVSFCKIGYADNALDLLWQGEASGGIENNIIYNFETAGIAGLVNSGAEGTYKIKNNLIYNDSIIESFGINFVCSDAPSANAVISNNTIAKNDCGICCCGGNFNIINNLLADCETESISLDDVNGQTVNNGFYNSAAAGNNYVICGVSPFETAGLLGGHFLNNITGGGALLKNAGMGNAAEYYTDAQDWTVCGVGDDGVGKRVFTEMMTILSGDTFWRPSENFDTGTVDIGYHHPRVDYFILPGASVFLSGNNLTVAPGTVVAIGGLSQSIQSGRIISNGKPFDGGRIKYMNYSLASAGWANIKYRNIDNGAVRPANSSSEFSFCDFTGLGYGILSGAMDKQSHDNIFKNNYMGLQSNTARNSLFVGNFIGMYHAFGKDFEAINCTFEKNTQYGLYVMSNPNVDYTVKNCVFTNNGTAGIFEFAWLKAGSSLAENNNAFYQNENHKIFKKNNDSTYDALGDSDYSGQPYIGGTTEIYPYDFYDGWEEFGERFYLPQHSELVDGGDASDGPMYGYTTDAINLVIDDDRRDIGYHYAVSKEYWVKASNSAQGRDGSENNPFNSIDEMAEETFCKWDIIHIVTDGETDNQLATLFDCAADGYGLLLKDWPERRYFSKTIYHNGIRWTFDREYRIGKFCNADFWVLGPRVEIACVTPAPNGSGIEFRNGSMLNPLGNNYQAYDGRAPGFYGTIIGYPLLLEGTNSLISSASIINQPLECDPGSTAVYDGYNDVSFYCVHYGHSGNYHSRLYSAAALTTVCSCPSADAFRPPYSGSIKPFFTKTALHKNLLPSLPLFSKPNVTYLNWVSSEYRNVWIDHKNGYEARFVRPVKNMPNYGREIGKAASEASCLLMLDYSEEELNPLLVNFVQTGIDLYYMCMNGTSWSADAGHDNGRKWPMIFAGIMLGNHEMKNIAHTGRLLGAEDLQTYQGQYKALWGRNCVSPYTATCSGTVGAKDCRDPEQLIDGCPDYRNCCTSNTWIGEAIAIKLMGAEDFWAHEAFYDYAERWYTADVPAGGEVLGGPYIRDVWNAYWPSGVAVIDNGQAGSTSFTGTWASSAAANPYSTGSIWSYNGATYTWILRPSVTGTYRVSMWWTALATRSANVPVTIQHSSGTAEAIINQTENGGQWNTIGEYTMNAGMAYEVKITAPGTESPPSTCADAVKFEYLN